MPAGDGLGFHDEENLRPAAPDAAQCGPKQQVKGVQLWARPFPIEDGDLLPQSEDRQCEIATVAGRQKEFHAERDRKPESARLQRQIRRRQPVAALATAAADR